MVARTPHPGIGTVRIERPAFVQVVDLATCRTRRDPLPKAAPVYVAYVNQGATGTETIAFRLKPVLTVNERYRKDVRQGVPGPIMLLGTSPDLRWILYAIDPMGSASLAADGLAIRVVSTNGADPSRWGPDWEAPTTGRGAMGSCS